MVARSSPALVVTVLSDTEVLCTRTFNAPRDIVYRAMTEAEHIRNWWGRRGSSLSVCDSDLRVGGAWRFVERSADGSEHPFKGEWLVLDQPGRFAFTQIYDVAPINESAVLVTIELTENAGKTLMTETLTFDSKEDRDGMLQAGMEGGASESLDRLDEVLAKLKSR
jgi:uncharacterized protein YndB with AHSA1/START domain